MVTDKLTAKDFASSQDVKWCPGCGDYSILKQVQSILPDSGIPRENIVFISGIGCSSRFPYYMNTYGMHGIHGRAPAIATGLKLARPELDIWVITGDGDALSIGGNHLIHLFRRNVNLQVLLFNNEIYGLTKGQYSPTSEKGLKTKSSPMGVVDHPFNPLALALGAGASFVSRTMDRDPAHMKFVLSSAHQHKGTSFVEIYQNCVIFNDGVFEEFTDKQTKSHRSLFLEDQKPLVFEDGKKGIALQDGHHPVILDLENGFSVSDLMIHDVKDKSKAFILSRLGMDEEFLNYPRVFGVLYQENRPSFDDEYHQQMRLAKENQPNVDFNSIIAGKHVWEVA